MTTLTATVEVIRDRAGVPHVFAASTGDAYHGLGYVMAQDRLWQIDRLRRRALGRQAEVLGPEYVQSDLMHRAVGIPAIAAREAELLDPQTRGILERFVDGINRSISDNKLPVEFSLLEYEPEPFSVSDSIAILRGEWWSLNGRLQTLTLAEAANRLPEHLREAFLTPEAPEHRILPSDGASSNGHMGMSDQTGSNNWAVAGWRTATGKALLCSDPHQPFWVPASWYEYVLHGPEEDVGGAGHPGVPGVFFGTNGSVAWGITNNATSTRDLYREEVHPDDPNLYRDGDTWWRFEERIEEVRVRGEAPFRHVQRSTARGPIVNHVVPLADAEPPLALRWVGQEHLDDVRALINIGRARDWESFRAALRDWSVPVFNFGYADASGRVAYQCAGRIPMRGRDVRGYRQANEPSDDWHGYVPFDGLPSVVDPKRGYVASANERVAPDDYPYALHGSFGAGYRAARLHQVLGDGSKPFDRERAIGLQNDIKSCRAERLRPKIIDWLTPSEEPEVVLLRDTLAAWNLEFDTDSIAPTLFDSFMEVWQEHVARERFPADLVHLVKGSGAAALLVEHGDDDLHWFERDLRAEIVSAAAEAMARVRSRYGEDQSKWTWGDVHQAHWKHPLSAPDRTSFDIGPAPLNGGADTVRNTGAGDPAFSASSGAEYRLVVDFAEPDRFLAVQNIGNSGNPEDPHYADQFADFVAGRYHVVHLQREDLERDAEGTLVLHPPG